METEVNIFDTEKGIEISIQGDLNIYNLHFVKAKILLSILNTKSIEFDLFGITEFDSAAVQFFIALKKHCQKSKKKLILKNHSSSVLQIFGTYGLIGFFEDKVYISASEKDKYPLKYGTKKIPVSLR